MSSNDSSKTIINRLQRYAKRHQPAAVWANFSAFLGYYFANVAPEKLAKLAIATAYELVAQHWQLAQQRLPQKPLIELANPEITDTARPYTAIYIVTKNMPFLVDSIRMALNRAGFNVQFMCHPRYVVNRDQLGHLTEIAKAKIGEQVANESFIYLQIERVWDDKQLEVLQQTLADTLRDVNWAVSDWADISNRLQQCCELLSAETELAEEQAFLKWLLDKNFTFLGYQACRLEQQAGQQQWQVVADSALGIARLTDFSEATGPTAQSFLISKSIHRATVHRPAYMDYIAVRSQTADKIIVEHRFWGLYTSIAYNRSPSEIPLIRRKIAHVFASFELEPLSHTGKALLHILETFPRDELFRISEADLASIAEGILHLGESQQIKLFVCQDPLGRSLTCLVYVPRDRLNTDLREKLGAALVDYFHALDSSFKVFITEEQLVRIEYFLVLGSAEYLNRDFAKLEQQLRQLSHSWTDALQLKLLAEYRTSQDTERLQRYQTAFPVSYQAAFGIATAIADIPLIERALAQQTLQVEFQVLDKQSLGMRLYHPLQPIAPSDSLPVLENMGFRVLQQTPYCIHANTDNPCWLQVHRLEYSQADTLSKQLMQILADVFLQVWQGQLENDKLNALALYAGLDKRQIELMRAYCKYLLQSGLPFSQSYIQQCLNRHADLVSRFCCLFDWYFNPTLERDATLKRRIGNLKNQLYNSLDKIASLDEDRILRNLLELLRATLRTNFYQTQDGYPKSWIAFKIAAKAVLELPEPRPLYEIFVYSVQFEAVHLRTSKVARGGIRWSDRLEDFRTEILGLVKAQQVKNSVIVPTGAKGGFIAKALPPTSNREALMAEIIARYQKFIRGLLDLTDNIQQGQIIPPPDLVRYDDDDPYLVVAADKGTATFSDYANALAAEYKFWLDDAFASGGSSGYDHKKMGITARGAWEAVKLHARDIGKNIQREATTVVGIGDMSGDVFGNGMLLSRQLKLIAAFNHQHIFIDPDPDPAISFKERQRLFRMPRSSWTDYNPGLISDGGGVYSRDSKSINLSKAAQKALQTSLTKATPAQLIQCILQAPVDILWNGGIGTYVKASDETHPQIGDRSNDALRIDATELRCRIVGEGGNLGFSQRARIEYALLGGRIDTDFIHNAGGVDCSDHEVNIKILLNSVMAAGKLERTARDKLLASMTAEVADLVLQSNYWQTIAINLMTTASSKLLDEHSEYIRELVNQKQLNRKLEQLPDDKTLTQRKNQGLGLTRPELAVLLSYSKNIVQKALVDSDLIEDDYFLEKLQQYFPKPLQEQYSSYIKQHPLRRELIATIVTDRMLNHMGCSFVYRLQMETVAKVVDIVRAYTIAWQVFDMQTLWHAIAALDYKIESGVQNQLMLAASQLVYRATYWLLLQHRSHLDITSTVTKYAPTAAYLQEWLLQGDRPQHFGYQARKLPQPKQLGRALWQQVNALAAGYCTFDIVIIAKQTDKSAQSIIPVYFELADRLGINWLYIQANRLSLDNQWQVLASKALIDDLFRIQRKLTRNAIAFQTGKQNEQQCLEKWQTHNQTAINHYLAWLQDVRAVESPDLTMLTVIIRELQNLFQACIRRTESA